MRISTFLVLGAFLALGSGTVRAQEAPPPPKPPLFSTLFTQTTGMNGYEEWIQAGDLVRNNSRLNEAINADATLTFKRQVLADPAVQQALHLLREGLNKPAIAPPEATDDNPFFASMASFRNLARLLYVQMYVQFAEGRVDAAIDTLSTGLRFGYRIRMDRLLSGLVGITVDTIVLKGFTRHLEQLSEYQCSRVRRVVEDWIEWPSPLTILVNSEKQIVVRSLEAKRNNTGGLKQLLGLTDASADETEPVDPAEQVRLQKLKVYLDSQPADLGRVIDEAEAMIGNYYDMMITNIKLPVTERKPFLSLESKSLSGILTSLVAPTFTSIVDKYDKTDAMLRLLGTHAAIRSYRWEHNSLPVTLAELRIGKLGLDPFTGTSLLYQRKGTTYDLHSRGPNARDDNGLYTANFSTVLLPTSP